MLSTYWFESPLSVYASYNDLTLIKSLVAYRKNHSEIPEKVLQKLLHHLCYLSDELICLFFFDKRVPYDPKKRMVTALKKKSKKEPVKKVDLNSKTLKALKLLKLDDFVTIKILKVVLKC